MDVYTDADWASSVTGFSLGLVVISWLNRKQSSMALSTTEEEHIETCVASKKEMWLRKLLADLYGHEINVTMIFYDSCVKFLDSTTPET